MDGEWEWGREGTLGSENADCRPEVLSGIHEGWIETQNRRARQISWKTIAVSLGRRGKKPNERSEKYEKETEYIDFFMSLFLLRSLESCQWVNNCADGLKADRLWPF